MAWLDKGLKQRIVGALVLIALAVVFIPMLLTREDERRQVRVEAPPIPKAPASLPSEIEPVQVPEPVDPVATLESEPPQSAVEPVQSADTPEPAAPTVTEPAATAPAVEPRLDANTLPLSWSIQLASLSNRTNAEALVKKLREQGYNAYLRQVDGMNRVFVGPLIERNEAERLRDVLKRQQKLNGFVVRFEPERR